MNNKIKTLFFSGMLFLSPLQSMANSYFHPQVSPNGKQVAFYGYVGKQPDLFIADLSTNKVTRLTETIDNWEIEPRWLDQQTLAFSSGANMRKIRLFDMDIKTGKQRLLTGHKELETFVAIDSKTNRVWSNWQQPTEFNLFTTSVGGGNEQQITQLDGIFVHQVFWRKKLALATYQDDIVLIHLDGRLKKRLVDSKAKESHPYLNTTMDKLLYVSDQHSKGDVYLKDLKNGKVKRVTQDDMPEYAPRFLPGDNKIVYAGVQTDKMDILIADLDGRVLFNLTREMH